MKYKSIILKILTILLWVGIGSGMMVLLVSAVQKEQKQKCNSLEISFTDNQPFRMLDEAEIVLALWPSAANDHPVGKYTSSINLYALEKQLKRNPWVLDADIYLDQQNTLHVDVQQRSPVARLFSPDGNSFYIDDSLAILPIKLSDVVELPVFTNFLINPAGAQLADTLMMKRITGLSGVIRKDPFWMAQIEQVNINAYGSFEMITQMGDQTVSLGTGENWEDMLGKLKKLYKHLGVEHGWTKYETIDLQFKDQVVCVKRGVPYALVDSLPISDSISMKAITDSLNIKH
jgi:cell division protein FtsQ